MGRSKKIVGDRKGRRSMKSPLTAVLAAALIVAFGYGGDALAKKKVSYDQAWKICKDQMDKDKIPGTTGQSNERHTRGAGCMKKYGYRI
jgi:hypothetical protein